MFLDWISLPCFRQSLTFVSPRTRSIVGSLAPGSIYVSRTRPHYFGLDSLPCARQTLTCESSSSLFFYFSFFSLDSCNSTKIVMTKHSSRLARLGGLVTCPPLPQGLSDQACFFFLLQFLFFLSCSSCPPRPTKLVGGSLPSVSRRRIKEDVTHSKEKRTIYLRVRNGHHISTNLSIRVILCMLACLFFVLVPLVEPYCMNYHTCCV